MDKLLLEKIDSLYKSLNEVSDRIPANIADEDYSNDLSDDEDGIDLRELVGTLVDSKWLIFLITTVILLLGVAKAMFDVPVYKLDALLQIEEAPRTLGDLDPMASMMGAETPVQAEISIIKSRMVLGEAVGNLNMDIVAEPKYFPAFGRTIARKFLGRHPDKVSTPLFGYTKYAWGGEIIIVKSLYLPEKWKGKKMTLIAGKKGTFKVIDFNNQLIVEGNVGEPLSAPIKGEKSLFRIFVPLLKARPGTHFTLSKNTVLNVISSLQKKISIREQDKKSGIISFTIESETPGYAMQILNEIADIYVRQNVEQKSAEAQQTLEFLESQLPKVKNQLEVSTAALNEYRLKKGSIDLNIETEGVLSGVVELKTEITILLQKKDELNRNFTEFHPTVISLDKQINRLRKQLQKHNKEIESLPETQQVILRLTRDVEVDTQLYTELLNQLQTIKVTKAGTVGNVRIIDYAVLPTIPVKPKKALIVATAFIFGLILGVAVALIRKAMRQGVEDPSFIEKHLNVPVYATVPHSDFQQRESKKLRRMGGGNHQFLNEKKRRKRDAVLDGISELQVLSLHYSEDLAVESLRSLRTTLHFAFLEAKNNIILISGPSPGIGKSFISTNLAVILAQSGKRVLLIDADMRRGLLHKTLGVSRENGLSDLISNSSLEPKDVIKNIEAAGLHFISTGDIPPNPSELLLHERFDKILEIYNEHYDLVIVDSPPILAVTDASIIGRLASVSLLVIKSGEHSLGDLALSIKRFKQNKVDIKGIVINDIPPSSANYGYEKYTYN